MSPRAAIPLLALGLGLVLAGCPIPQPLPEYDAGTITPPRILVDRLARSIAMDGGRPGDGNPILFVPARCSRSPMFRLSAQIVYTNNTEAVEARWFVNYDPRSTVNRTWVKSSVIAANADATNLERNVPEFEFAAYDFGPSPGAPPVPPETGPNGNWYPQDGILRVVELVVTQGFDPTVVGTSALSNRAPQPGFETQVHRWVLLSVPASSSVPCP